MADRRTPFVNADERDTLLAFLDYLRESIIVKVTGLDTDTVRRTLVPSGTNLLGLVKHLTTSETYWFQWSLAGHDVTIPADALDGADTTESVVAAYRDAIRRNNEIVAATPDLGLLSAHHHGKEGPMSLRWILVHMVEETGRHAGHADILREQLDGQTGR
jgi:uncharacterized damage-inducible protein DinB